MMKRHWIIGMDDCSELGELCVKTFVHPVIYDTEQAAEDEARKLSVKYGRVFYVYSVVSAVRTVPQPETEIRFYDRS